ncbi:MAG TPA: hypothetical protein VEK33_02365 [Terriglobales bacterium]|nr:hypothetical protein [Terriglobales bacterium]
MIYSVGTIAANVGIRIGRVYHHHVVFAQTIDAHFPPIEAGEPRTGLLHNPMAVTYRAFVSCPGHATAVVIFGDMLFTFAPSRKVSPAIER